MTRFVPKTNLSNTFQEFIEESVAKETGLIDLVKLIFYVIVSVCTAFLCALFVYCIFVFLWKKTEEYKFKRHLLKVAENIDKEIKSYGK